MAAPPFAALGKILLVSGDAGLLRRLDTRFRTDGYAVDSTVSAQQALDCLDRIRPDLLIVDLDTGDGAELLARVEAHSPGMRLIVIASEVTRSDLAVAAQQDVFGHLTRPLDDAELGVMVARSFRVTHTADADNDRDAEIVTWHPLTRAVLRQARLVAATDASVSIVGGVGTGKELIAQTIHRASIRRHKPLFIVNCSGIDEEIIEYEVLGAENGAFSGAARSLAALFAIAAGTTLMLDRVDSMPVNPQPELLRLLKRNRPRPDIGVLDEHPDVRILATTTRDLPALAADGGMLADLAHRLSVVNIRLPALGDRREDIPVLASQFLEQIAAESGQPRKIYTPEALELLVAADWPGNMRQLFSIVRRNVALSHSPVIDARIVARSLGNDARQPALSAGRRDDWMRDYLAQILELSCGRVSRAARLAKRNRTDFYALLARYRVDPESFRRP